MGVVIIISNYLVQFPVNKFNLQEVLTYGAFSYPITFLITDLANRRFGKQKARKLVYFGFVVGILLTLFVSTNFNDIISIRIAIGSGTAFLVAQLVDVEIFQRLRNNAWFVAPMTSSVFGSGIDTFLFFSISFLGTGVPWVTLAFGDLFVKLLMALLMLIPFRLLILKISDLNVKTNI
jgi:queuosine precursor transporter